MAGPVGSGSASGSFPESWPAVSSSLDSRIARGFPPVPAWMPWATMRGTGAPSDPASSRRQASTSMPRRTMRSTPGENGFPSTSVRLPSRIAMRSAWIRRLAKRTARSDDASSHWRSSTITTMGCRSAEAARMLSVAAKIAKGSEVLGGPRARAPISAAACGAGTSGISSRTGWRSSARPPNGSSDSDSMPDAVSTVMPLAVSSA